MFQQEIIFRHVPEQDNGKEVDVTILNLHHVEWLFIHTAYFLIDGERYEYESIKEDTEVLGGGNIQEWVVFDTSSILWKDIANSKKTQFRFVGDKGVWPGESVDIEISDKTKEKIKEFLQQI
jgi:hypothetical protein